MAHAFHALGHTPCNKERYFKTNSSISTSFYLFNSYFYSLFHQYQIKYHQYRTALAGACLRHAVAMPLNPWLAADMAGTAIRPTARKVLAQELISF